MRIPFSTYPLHEDTGTRCRKTMHVSEVLALIAQSDSPFAGILQQMLFMPPAAATHNTAAEKGGAS